MSLGDGTGNFATPTPFTVGNGPWSVTVANLNQDNLPDLVTVNSTDGTISVLLNGLVNTSGIIPINGLSAGDQLGLSVSSAGDVNNDDIDDLIIDSTSNLVLSQTNELVALGDSTGTGKIKGQIWYDQNNNSQLETSEGGLEGWLVYLDINQNAKFDFDEPFATTDTNGNYSFSNLATGTYTVRQFLNEGWTQTYPRSYINGDFESGNFSNWLTTGDYKIEKTSPDADYTLGNFQAKITTAQGSLLVNQLEIFLGLNSGRFNNLSNSFPSQGFIRRNVTEGSAIAQIITVSAGDRLTFDYNFLTNDYLPYNDFAFFSVSSDKTQRIASIQSDLEISPTPYVEETGWRTLSYTFADSGTFTVGVGVVDIGDRVVDSALLVDNFTLTSNNYIININGGEIVDKINFGNYLPNLPKTIQFNAANYTVKEENGKIEILLTRSGDTSTSATVTVKLNNGTAQQGIDFDSTSKTVNFATGEVSQTITIPITHDNLIEGNENFILSLTNPNNAQLGIINTAIVTIIDSGTSVGFSQPSYQINEDGTPEGIEITVIRNGDLNISSVEGLYSFAENQAIGTQIGTFSTVDPDIGETYTYTLLNDSPFTINGDRLLTSKVFDYETQDSYLVLVQVTDGNGGVLQTSFAINITDVSEISNPDVSEISGTTGRDILTGTPNDDIIKGFQGNDVLTGNGGNDQFVYTSITDAGDTIKDFTPGQDQIVLTQLLSSLGYNGSNPIADGYVQFTAQGSNSSFLRIDADGFAGSSPSRPFIFVENVPLAALNVASNFVF